MNPPCYFVTGASGFVGRHLCQRLRAGGARVRGLVRRADPTLTDLGVEVIHGELDAPAEWKNALSGVDYLIHCAANASFGGGTSYAKVNVEGTRRLLDAARDAGTSLRRFVFVSTIGAIDRRPSDSCAGALDENSPAAPTSDYGRSKLAAEKLVRESRLPFSIVRPAMVVGADMRCESHFAVFVRAAVRGAPLARFAWPGAFSVVHVDDLASALELCATHPAAAGRTFFCAGSGVALRDSFAKARPAQTRLPMRWVPPVARLVPAAIPFKLKALLLPALTASDAPLRALGWQPQHEGIAALDDVVARERARLDPEIDPGGQTVITGAASGLGRALVERLASRRRNLLLIDRDLAGLEMLRTRFPNCRIAAADLADEQAVTGLVRSDAWRMIPVTELFACAGMGIRGPVLAAETERHARLFKVNVLARLALAQAAAPGMVRAGFGRVVFVSSSSAFQPLPFMATYAASNSALLSLGEAWGAELAGSGVHLLTICPGGMQTNFQRAAGVKTIESEKLMAPETVAEEIMRGLARGRMTAIISTRSLAMSLLARVLPRRLSVALWKKLMTQLR
jgi:uncharacterized protein